MILLERLLSQRKLVLTLSGLLAVLGLFFWFNMARQEDPRMPDLWGQIITPFPGADAETVERLVLKPLEEELASVDEIKEVSSTAYAEVAVVKIDLRDNIKKTDLAWDEVREALVEARREFPAGVGEPRLNDELQDNESVVYALTGSADPLQLLRAAEKLKDHLLRLPAVSEIKLIAEPDEQIALELDDAEARRLGLDPQLLAAQLGRRTQILPGGSVELGGRSVTLRPLSEFESLEEIRTTAVALPAGGTVPLSAIARVRRGPAEPVASRMRFNGEPGVGVGVVPRAGGNILNFGEMVREEVARRAPELAPVEIHEVIFQPDRVRQRLSDLGRSLILGVMIVAGVLFLAMGMRLGLIVASVVPLVVLASLAIYAIGGGTLHQISIAAVVIALGMLVDNAIVMAEGIQWRLDQGESRHQAAIGAVRELAVPLAAATGTTLAAFIPMLLAEGGTGEFTRAIPVVIMLTLTMSYLFAIFVTPALAELFLRSRRDGGEAGPQGLERHGAWLGGLAVKRPGLILLVAGLAVLLSVAGAGQVPQQFFPSSDRNQLVLDLRLPEGSHLDATDRESRKLEQALLEHPQVVSVASFLGRSTPKFYYNLNFIPFSPHLAQVIVETTSTATLNPVMEWIRDYVGHTMPGVELVVRKLEQGPSIEAPVEVRLFGDSLADLSVAADAVLGELRATPGAEDVRHTLGSGAPMLRFEVDDAAAARRGVSRRDVALALFGRTRGLPVGEFRGEDDPIPVVLKSSAGERYPVEQLSQLAVSAPGTEPVPLSQVARVDLQWRPAAVHHYQGRRVVRVLSELEEGASYSGVLAALLPRLEALTLPDGVSWAIGGAAEGSGEANVAVMRVLPVGVLLLLAILMAEFRSFRRVGIVLVTVPLAAAGVIPGLLLSGQPFGFMSLLGVFSLIGVVVNNAIVLLEVVEARRKEGADLDLALRDAVERRLRPIVLTTATTVAGLLPLAFSASTLWPPMAWAMISGLVASTFLTVLVVPALYRLLFAKEQGRRDEDPPLAVGLEGEPSSPALGGMAAAILLVLLALPAAAQSGLQTEPQIEAQSAPLDSAQEVQALTLSEVMREALARPQAVAARQRAEAAAEIAVAQRRLARWPMLTAGAAISDRSEEFDVVTPLGNLRFGDSRSEDAELALTVPLLDPARRFHGAPAAGWDAEASREISRRVGQQAVAQAAEGFLDVLALDARRQATQSLIDSLDARLQETLVRVEAGRTLRADALKVELALDGARQELRALDGGRRVATEALGYLLGRSGAVEPKPLEAPLPPLPAWSPLLAQALAARPDLAAGRNSLEAAQERAKAVKAERLPRLQASARWIWSTGSPYRQDNWLEGRIGISWNPFAAGSRGPRVRALELEAMAQEQELTEAHRGIEVELHSAWTALDTAHGAIQVGEKGVVQATENLRVEQERFAAGRTTTNDLLAAEAELRRQRTGRDVARLEAFRAWIRLRLAIGLELPAGAPLD